MMRNRRIAEDILTALKESQAVNSSQSTAGTQVLAEALQNVMAMLGRDEEGWDLFIGGEARESGGLTLDDLKKWEKKLQEFEVANAWGKRGFSLRDSYINQHKIEYDGIRKGGSGQGVNVQDKIDHPINQRAFFNRAARRRREGRLYHSGFALWIGKNDSKLLEAIPLNEITGILTDQDHPGIIWAYRREWTRREISGATTPMKRWYFVDTYKEYQTESIMVGVPKGPDDKGEIVETSYTAFDMHANTVEGWAFGVPDALAAHIWAEIAKGLYMDGVDVSEAMASIAFKASAGTSKAGQNAALQFASPQGAGSTTVLGAASDLTAMTSAKSGYDFSSVREIVALIAASLDVSNIHLTANPGDAGSSYGSAATLDLPTRLAMMTRREEHVALDTRVLQWMAGSAEAAKKIKVYFPPLEDPAEQYRKMQMAVLPWLQGVVDPEIFQGIVSKIMGIPDLGSIPDGILIPNNKASLPRRDIDADSSGGGSGTDAGGGQQAASPTQGRGNGAGSDDGRPADTRSDTQN